MNGTKGSLLHGWLNSTHTNWRTGQEPEQLNEPGWFPLTFCSTEMLLLQRCLFFFLKGWGVALSEHEMERQEWLGKRLRVKTQLENTSVWHVPILINACIIGRDSCLTISGWATPVKATGDNNSLKHRVWSKLDPKSVDVCNKVTWACVTGWEILVKTHSPIFQIGTNRVWKITGITRSFTQCKLCKSPFFQGVQDHRVSVLFKLLSWRHASEMNLGESSKEGNVRGARHAMDGTGKKVVSG